MQFVALPSFVSYGNSQNVCSWRRGSKCSDTISVAMADTLQLRSKKRAAVFVQNYIGTWTDEDGATEHFHMALLLVGKVEKCILLYDPIGEHAGAILKLGGVKPSR